MTAAPTKADAKAVPKNCLKCGAEPVVQKLKPRLFRVVCSKNSVTMLGHRVFGHEMYTKKEAIDEWNKIV